MLLISIRFEGDYSQHEKKDHRPWDLKRPVAYWRGNPTGGNTTTSNMNTFPRHRLLKMFQNNPLFDIAFTSIVQCPDKECEEQTREQFKFSNHKNYKYMTK